MRREHLFISILSLFSINNAANRCKFVNDERKRIVKESKKNHRSVTAYQESIDILSNNVNEKSSNNLKPKLSQKLISRTYERGVVINDDMFECKLREIFIILVESRM